MDHLISISFLLGLSWILSDKSILCWVLLVACSVFFLVFIVLLLDQRLLWVHDSQFFIPQLQQGSFVFGFRSDILFKLLVTINIEVRRELPSPIFWIQDSSYIFYRISLILVVFESGLRLEMLLICGQVYLLHRVWKVKELIFLGKVSFGIRVLRFFKFLLKVYVFDRVLLQYYHFSGSFVAFRRRKTDMRVCLPWSLPLLCARAFTFNYIFKS